MKAEKLYYTALIAYIWYEAPDEEQNFSMLIDLVDASEAREDDENFNLFNKQGIEEDWSRIDLLNSLPTLPLTPNQYAYVECIIRNGAPMTSAEIAREIGVTPAAVSAIKKSLSKKLENFF